MLGSLEYLTTLKFPAVVIQFGTIIPVVLLSGAPGPASASPFTITLVLKTSAAWAPAHPPTKKTQDSM